MANRIVRERLILSLGFAVGILLLVFAFTSARTGRDEQGLPIGLQRLSPAGATQVLRQTEVVVTLDPGYCARLTIDAIDLPTYSLEGQSAASPVTPDSVSSSVALCGTDDGASSKTSAVFNPAQATISFTPTQDSPIPEFGKGAHLAKVTFWRVENPDVIQTHTWSFNVDA